MTTAAAAAEPRAIAFDEAIAAYRGGERAQLLPGLEQALRSGSGDPRLWHLHGLVLRELDRRADALPSLRRAAAMAPGSVKIAHSLARTLLEAGLPSIEAYGNALRLAPADEEIALGLASALIAEGEPETAISGLERIVARSPHWVEGHVLLSGLRWSQGDRRDFARSFDQALQSRPKDLELRRAHMIALLHAERYEDVLRSVEAGRAAMGEHVLFTANEAIIHAEMGETDVAETLFAPIADVADSVVQIRRVRMYLRSGQPDTAAQIIDTWLKTPDALSFWPYASLAWRMLGDPRWQWLEGDESLVGVYDIADRLPAMDTLVAKLRKLHVLNGQPLEQSLRGGSQTGGNLFWNIDPAIVQLRDAIRATVAEHVSTLPPPDDSHPLLGAIPESIRFSGAWSVRLHGGGYHANHVHPMGWMSSALYLVLPPDCGAEGAGCLTLGEPDSNLALDIAPFRTVEPTVGRLVLFPSYMWHGTRPFGEGERMTVAFDVERG